MQKRVKLSVIKENQINAVYGFILNLNPLTIQCEQADNFKENSIIIFPETVDNNREIHILKVKNTADNTVVFERVKRIDDIFFKNHYIEFSHIFSIAEVDSHNELKYKALAANINRQELNSTASRLKEVFSRDEVENREIITFLIDINSKLDEILHLLKPKENIEGAEEYLSLILSEEGIIFACKKEILCSKIFAYTTIRDSGGFFSFASLCSVEKLMDSGEYIIYKGMFTDLSLDAQDKIIKCIFRLEREMLKEANK